MIQAGITGGIGSGKSYVANIFEHLGVPVFRADQSGRRLMESNPELIAEVARKFPSAVENQKINRKKLAELVFHNPQKLEILNSIIHPAVAKDYENWLKNQNHPYVLKEAAILIESGTYKDLDKIIVVIAPKDERIARTRKRDSVSLEEVEARMANQMPEPEKVKFADYVISNADGIMLLPQVLEIDRKLKDKSQSDL